MSLLVGAEAAAAAAAEEVAVVAVAAARHDRGEDSLPPAALPVRRVRNLDPAPEGTKRLARDLGELAQPRHKAAPAPVARVRALALNVPARPLLASDQAPRPGNDRPLQPDSVPAPVKVLRLLPASVPLQGN